MPEPIALQNTGSSVATTPAALEFDTSGTRVNLGGDSSSNSQINFDINMARGRNAQGFGDRGFGDRGFADRGGGMSGTRGMLQKLSQLIGQLKSLLSSMTAAGSLTTESLASGTASSPIEPLQPKPICNRSKGELPFQTKIREFLKPDTTGSISEANLQYGIVAFQLYQKDPSIEAAFQMAFREANEDGLSTEEATKLALRKVRDDGMIESWEANWTYSLSYRAAQLDADTDSLSDSSSASQNFDAATFTGEVALAYIQGGTLTVPTRELD